MIKAAHAAAGAAYAGWKERGYRAAFDAAAKEAFGAFGDGTLYMEKCISDARHIEVQIICDNFGGAAHLLNANVRCSARNQ
jgi:acetyl-CoA carboxylase biotin carboxylase subunit